MLDSLLDYHSVDIQWGNHDILWMGAASGSRALVATVLANSLRYNNLEVIETGYGISLRPLSVFANEVYRDCDVHCFRRQADRAWTAIPVHRKGQAALRPDVQGHHDHPLQAGGPEATAPTPDFGMADRLLLDQDRLRRKNGLHRRTSHIPLEDCDFPTVDPADPYAAHGGGGRGHQPAHRAPSVRSEKLQRHIRFLYSKGSLYKVFNGNLLFHGCIPMTSDGKLLSFSIGGKERCGQAFLDYAELTARQAYYDKPGSPERLFGMDFLWWLWAGRNSPIFGRDRMTTFERRLIADEIDLGPSPKTPTTTCYQRPSCLRYAAAGIWPGRASLPHHQRPHPRQVQKGREPHQGRRQADRHRRRLLQGLSAHHAASRAIP